MRSLNLALRGIWWRRWSSLAIWAVAVVCTAIAAAGPAFAANAQDAVLQSNLRHAPIDARGSGVTLSLPLDRGVPGALLEQRTRQAFAPLLDAG